MRYIKHNAIAGRTFEAWAQLEGHLSHWGRTVADVRVHGTTGERPLERFERPEAAALKPLGARPSFQPLREVRRRVQADSCVAVDTNHYRVPWRLSGEGVTVQVADGQVRVLQGGAEGACHRHCEGRRHRCLEAAHLAGLVGGPKRPDRPLAPATAVAVPAVPELLRPLAEYEALAGGAW